MAFFIILFWAFSFINIYQFIYWLLNHKFVQYSHLYIKILYCFIKTMLLLLLLLLHFWHILSVCFYIWRLPLILNNLSFLFLLECLFFCLFWARWIISLALVGKRNLFVSWKITIWHVKHDGRAVCYCRQCHQTFMEMLRLVALCSDIWWASFHTDSIDHGKVTFDIF